MPFNGSGTFTVDGAPFAPGTIVASSPANAKLNDLAGGLSNAMTRDGQSPATANIPLGNHKITGLLSGTVGTDAANLAQVQGARAQINVLINANPLVNQRGYASGTPTSTAFQYTLDRWRVVTSGESLVFSLVGAVCSFTAPLNGVEQVVEASSIQGGTYTLSWTGTATATVAGTPVANGAQTSLPSGVNATVRFINGTVSLPQLELSPVASPFEWRFFQAELALCQRYYARTIANTRFYAAINTITCETPIYWPVAMRTTPTVVIFSGPTRLNITAVSASPINAQGGRHSLTSAIIGDSYALGDVIEMSAEL